MNPGEKGFALKWKTFAIYFGLTYSVNADNLYAISAIANKD